MKEYKEKEIDIDTGEYIDPPKKTNKNKEYKRLGKLFDKLASGYSGRPITTPRSYFIVANAVNKHGMTYRGIEALYIDWFDNSKIKDQDKVKMNWCLGSNNINQFKVKN